jgi:hypothetical protein
MYATDSGPRLRLLPEVPGGLGIPDLPQLPRRLWGLLQGLHAHADR